MMVSDTAMLRGVRTKEGGGEAVRPRMDDDGGERERKGEREKVRGRRVVVMMVVMVWCKVDK